MKFEISAEYLFHHHKGTHQTLSTMTPKEFEKAMATADNIYKKLDYVAQGEYHHLWCEYITS